MSSRQESERINDMLARDGLVIDFHDSIDGTLTVTISFTSGKMAMRLRKRAEKKGMDLDTYMQKILEDIKADLSKKQADKLNPPD